MDEIFEPLQIESPEQDQSPLVVAKEIIEGIIEGYSIGSLAVLAMACWKTHNKEMSAAVREIYGSDRRYSMFRKPSDAVVVEAIWDEVLPSGFDSYTSPRWLRVLFAGFLTVGPEP